MLVLPGPPGARPVSFPEGIRLFVQGHSAARSPPCTGLPSRASPLWQRQICADSLWQHFIRSATSHFPISTWGKAKYWGPSSRIFWIPAESQDVVHKCLHQSIFFLSSCAGRESNFQKVQTNNLGTPYDFNSVMHYSKWVYTCVCWSIVNLYTSGAHSLLTCELLLKWKSKRSTRGVTDGQAVYTHYWCDRPCRRVGHPSSTHIYSAAAGDESQSLFVCFLLKVRLLQKRTANHHRKD